MDLPLLIMNVKVFSVDMDTYYLTSKEAILRCDNDMVIKIPLYDAQPINGGPVIGEYYFVRYMDGIGDDFYPPEFQYLGMKNKQLVFSSTRKQAA